MTWAAQRSLHHPEGGDVRFEDDGRVDLKVHVHRRLQLFYLSSDIAMPILVPGVVGFAPLRRGHGMDLQRRHLLRVRPLLRLRHGMSAALSPVRCARVERISALSTVCLCSVSATCGWPAKLISTGVVEPRPPTAPRSPVSTLSSPSTPVVSVSSFEPFFSRCRPDTRLHSFRLHEVFEPHF